MAERIGFIYFRAFDPIDPLTFYGQKRHIKRLQHPNEVLSLAEAFPTIPPWRPYAPELDLTPDNRVYKLRNEMNPLMNVYHEWIYKMAVRREILNRWVRRHQSWDNEALLYFKRLDQLHAWMINLYFQRVEKRQIRLMKEFQELHAIQDKIERQFHQEHKTKRFEEAQLFPFIYRKLLKNPNFHEVREPNEWKNLEFDRASVAENRYLLKDEVRQLWSLRYKLADSIEAALEQHLRIGFRHRVDQQQEWIREHYKTMLQLYEDAWRKAWDQRDWFMTQERNMVVEQAEYFPQRFRKDLKDPYKPEIKLPNQPDLYESLQNDIDASRRLLKAEVRELSGLRAHHEEQIVQEQTKSVQQQAAILHMREARQAYEHDKLNKVRTSSDQGFVYLAGRAIPRAPIAIDSDHRSPLPLTLGLHGEPHTPERTNPLSIQVPAHGQKALYNKAIDVQRLVDFHQETQGRRLFEELAKRFRSQWALQDYMEGQLQEHLQSTQPPIPAEAPQSNEQVQALLETKLPSMGDNKKSRP
jgi:hypothetical protein